MYIITQREEEKKDEELRKHQRIFFRADRIARRGLDFLRGAAEVKQSGSAHTPCWLAMGRRLKIE